MEPLSSSQPSTVVGLVGAGIQASRTPALHEREAAAHGLRYAYKLIDLDRLGLGPEALPDLLVAAERMGFAGLNVTYPCKQAVIPFLHELSDQARAPGAVNTIVLRDGRRIGHNTDWSGFAEGFRRGLPGAPLGRVVQMGAGGAGAAVAHAALLLGADRLSIFDVEPTRAEALAHAISARFGAGRAVAGGTLADAVAAADGLINATPVGMAGRPGTPLPTGMLHPALWVADIVYVPLETALLRAAAARGCRTLGGGGMAVFQAVEALRLFAGIDPDAERMTRHFYAL